MTKHTILSCIERGELEASTTPGGHHRIREADALLFMRRHNVPTDAVERVERRILLVGAQATTRESVLASLEGTVFAVDVAESAFDAGIICERIRADLIVLSVTLPPSIESMDLVRQVMRSRTLRGFRVLALVTPAPVEARRALAEEGIREFLTRPFTPSELRERVQRILGRRPMRTASLA